MKTCAAMLMAACIVLAAPLMAQEAAPLPETRNGIVYVSGGIGDEQRQAMLELRKDFNLTMTFALKKSGEYLSDIHLRVEDSKGMVLLDTVASGPLLYARLPAGAYVVSATSHGRQLTQTLKVAANKRRELNFYWSGEK